MGKWPSYFVTAPNYCTRRAHRLYGEKVIVLDIFNMNGADSPRSVYTDEGDHTDGPCGWFVHPLRLLGMVVALFLLSLPATAATGDFPRTLLVDGRQLPIFATAEEQLSYARSTFDEAEEKAAALKAIEAIHPSAREQAGMAALELAFLALGDDYRLVDKNQYLLASSSYLGILEKYPDLPAIAAKALWYLGWISCDLAADTQQGIRWYQRLIALFPDEKLSIVAPVPWLTIRPADPDVPQHVDYPKTILTWADIAHLEIIRHAASRDRAWQSFEAIEARAGEVFAAAALKVLVERYGFDDKSERLVREFLAKPGVDTNLKNDLLLALSVYRRQTDGPGGVQ